MKGATRIASTAICFAVASLAMTISTAIVIWFGNGGNPPLNVADAYIFIAEWPMVLLHGIDFQVVSEQSLLVNAVGWAGVGVLYGAWRYRYRS